MSSLGFPSLVPVYGHIPALSKSDVSFGFDIQPIQSYVAFFDREVEFAIRRVIQRVSEGKKLSDVLCVSPTLNEQIQGLDQIPLKIFESLCFRVITFMERSSPFFKPHLKTMKRETGSHDFAIQFIQTMVLNRLPHFTEEVNGLNSKALEPYNVNLWI